MRLLVLGHGYSAGFLTRLLVPQGWTVTGTTRDDPARVASAEEADAIGRAVVLAIAYCLGLGLPFVLVAAGMGWASRGSGWLRDHHQVVQRVGGGLLILLGLLMLAGAWAEAMAWVQTRLTSNFTTVI